MDWNLILDFPVRGSTKISLLLGRLKRMRVKFI
jgi:hypothetical protein